jgi:hypothetical protein
VIVTVYDAAYVLDSGCSSAHTCEAKYAATHIIINARINRALGCDFKMGMDRFFARERQGEVCVDYSRQNRKLYSEGFSRGLETGGDNETVSGPVHCVKSCYGAGYAHAAHPLSGRG